MGRPAPQLHVAEEFDGTGFVVAGGSAGGVVCWQVTGVRQDPSARAHPLAVEPEKAPEDIGRYVDPAAYDHGAGEHLNWAARMLARDEATPRPR
ncbi:hypothetical protein AB0F59_26255 [Micromonospora lupini]|uniref:hypothetical protein n=1 Tax=Micromonospora lupini TaxID=285679 RepID=UPI0033DB258B